MATANEAREQGFTRAVYIEGGCEGFEALIKPDTELDDRFRAFDTDNSEWMNVNGWNCLIENLEA